MRNEGLAADLGRRARSYALRLLEMQDRTAKELEGKLRGKGFPEDIIIGVLAEMRSYGYLDDEKLAARVADDGAESRGLGPLRIRVELARRGVAREIIEDAVSRAFGGDKENEVALGLAQAWVGRRRLAHDADVDADADVGAADADTRRRLYGFLARRGFSSDVIGRVLDKVLGQV
ncbi:MAG: regulatory protein RecX [Bacillota bacterium]|nr:regulatory protein RecX [Bacillota bacterium]